MAKKTIFAVAVLGLIFLRTENSLAYDAKTTHAALTSEIVDFMNGPGGGAITPEEKEWLIQGTIEEDTPPRWVNHFYDPVHNISWTGNNVGFIPSSVVNELFAIGVSPEGRLTARDWVGDRATQQSYSLYGGDWTWKRGLEYYADGDRKNAYIALGHALHLVEDMTVPDHTRDDPHAHEVAAFTGDYGSPYEEYLKKVTRTTIKEWHIADNLLKDNIAPPPKATIEDYLTSVAEYSNKYFFSKDTINNPAYSLPKIVREDDNFGYGVDENGQEFPIVKIKRVQVNQFDFNTKYLIEVSDSNILDAYFTRLSRQAVLNGAGVIALFRKQAEDAVINKDFPQHLVVIDPNVARWFSPLQFSLLGELVKVWDFVTKAGAATLAVFDKFIIALGPGVPGVGSTNPPQNSTDVPSAPAQEPTPPPGKATAASRASIVTSVNPASSTNTNATATTVASATDPVQLQEAQQNSFAVSSAAMALGSAITIISGGGGGGGGSAPTQASVNADAVSQSPAETSSSLTATSTTTEASSIENESISTPESASSALPAVTNFQGVFSTSTLAINFSWDPLAVASGTTSTITYAINDISDPGAKTLIAATASTSAIWPPAFYNRSYTFSVQALNSSTALSAAATASVPVPDVVFTVQPLDNEASHPSNYSDNWYELGAGFYGTVYDITLEGSIDDPSYATSHISLKEFLDKDYSRLNQTFVISDNAPFTATPARVAIDGLKIPLQSNKYYRLDTSEDLQNRSVVLGGASATGAAMWNEYVFGAGRVEHIYSFYPYLRLVMAKNYPPLSPPGPPQNLSAAFDDLNLRLGISWSSSTDPDTLDKLLRYEINISTSSALSDDGWVSVAGFSTSTKVVYPNSYVIGVRALDDFNNISTPAIVNWSFPAGFAPSLLGDEQNDVSQDFVLSGGGRLNSIKMLTSNFQTNSANEDTNICSVDLYAVNETSTILLARSDTPNAGDGESGPYAYRGSGCAGALAFTYSSASSTPEIVAGQRYRWRFHFDSGRGAVKFWGNNADTAGGPWSGGEFLNAKFTLTAGGVVLFGN